MGHEDAKGLHGRLFYADGTAVHSETKVEVTVGELTHRTTDPGGRSGSDGRFFVPIAEPFHIHSSKIYVRGELVDHRRLHHAGADRVLIVMPPMFGRGGGTEGGLITGKVIAEDGRPAIGAKVEAQVISSSMLGFLSPRYAKTKTDKKGRFALEFDGGTELKNITVDGNQLAGARRRTKDGSEADIDASVVKAGTFNLVLVREKKFLGLW